jgi:LPS sulfotransferase NodH
MDIWIISYPRSGSNFFIKEFSAMTGIMPNLTHHMDTPNTGVSCIRNPRDTISSFLAMKLSYDYNLDHIPSLLHQIQRHYKCFYTYLLNSKNIIVDYELFCKDPSSYVQKICNKLNINILENRLSMHEPVDNPERKYLVSSAASSEYYEVASKAVANLDLKELELLYEMVLSKSLSL